MSLGCNPSVSLQIRLTGTARKLTDITADDVVHYEYDRAANTISSAEIVLAVNAQNAACCAVLEQAEPAWFELWIIRDGDLAWSGPIWNTEYDTETGEFTIAAFDVLQWTTRRYNNQPHTWGRETTSEDPGEVVPAETIIGDLLADAFSLDDPNVLAHVKILPTGVRTARKIERRAQVYIYDMLRDLASAGVSFTVIGRSIIFFGTDTHPFGTVAHLSDADFSGGAKIIKDADEWITRAHVTGQDENITGEAGRPHTGYRLLDRIINDRGLLDAGAAQREAERQITDHAPGVPIIKIDDNAILAPGAPIDFTQLIPGVDITITVTGVCTPLTATLQLARISVRGDTDGERISITLARYARSPVKIAPDRYALTTLLRDLVGRLDRLERRP